MAVTYSDSGGVSDAAEDDLEKDSDIFDEASATETLLDPTDSVSSEGSDGDLPENASSTMSKKDPRTPKRTKYHNTAQFYLVSGDGISVLVMNVVFCFHIQTTDDPY